VCWSRTMLWYALYIRTATCPDVRGQVTHLKKWCHAYERVLSERVMSHIPTSHVTHTSESCHTYEGVMSHIATSHITQKKESCHTYEGVVSHIRRSHVAQHLVVNLVCPHHHLLTCNESCHTSERVIQHKHGSHIVHHLILRAPLGCRPCTLLLPLLPCMRDMCMCMCMCINTYMNRAM